MGGNGHRLETMPFFKPCTLAMVCFALLCYVMPSRKSLDKCGLASIRTFHKIFQVMRCLRDFFENWENFRNNFRTEKEIIG